MHSNCRRECAKRFHGRILSKSVEEISKIRRGKHEIVTAKFSNLTKSPLDISHKSAILMEESRRKLILDWCQRFYKTARLSLAPLFKHLVTEFFRKSQRNDPEKN